MYILFISCLCRQRVAIVGVSRGALGADEPSAKTAHRDTHLVAELALFACLAFCDALDARKMCGKQADMIFDADITANRLRFRVAFLLAIIADALQIAIFPLFVEGAESPAADILDLGVGAVLAYLLGWHWEFLPSFLAKLVPGVDLVPFWTMAVTNVYRKSKQLPVTIEGSAQARRTDSGSAGAAGPGTSAD